MHLFRPAIRHLLRWTSSFLPRIRTTHISAGDLHENCERTKTPKQTNTNAVRRVDLHENGEEKNPQNKQIKTPTNKNAVRRVDLHENGEEKKPQNKQVKTPLGVLTGLP
jgi:hypothetical protein